jgi:uncharacterized surface protein with fasciclin (FAS1) repeats
MAAAGVVGRPRNKPATSAVIKPEPLTVALAGQRDLQSFAAILKFLGAESALAAATDADFVAFAPTDDAFDAFAKEMLPGNPNATARDLLQDKYRPMLAHVTASHLAVDDDNDGVFETLAGGDGADGGEKLLVVAAAEKGGSARVSVLPTMAMATKMTNATTDTSTTATAKILREKDLGSAGDLYVIDRVLKPRDVFPSPSAAFKADPELSTFARLVAALTPDIAKSLDKDGAPATIFAPTNAAFAKFLAKAGVTERQVVAQSKKDAAVVAGTLAYHVVPDVALVLDDGGGGGNNNDKIASQAPLLLPTALVIGLTEDDDDDKKEAVLLRVRRVEGGGPLAIGGHGGGGKNATTTTTTTTPIFAGADILYKINTVLAVPGAVVEAEKQQKSSGLGRKLLRTAMRNNVMTNTQRSNIRRAIRGNLDLDRATRKNAKVGQLAVMGRVPQFFLMQSATRGGEALLG